MIVRLMIVRLMIVALRLMLVRILRELSYDCAFCMCGSILAGLAVVSGCGYSSGDGSADPIFACDLRRHRAGDLVVGGGGDGGLVVCVDGARGLGQLFAMVAMEDVLPLVSDALVQHGGGVDDDRAGSKVWIFGVDEAPELRR